jgi:hypothetical protein
MTKAGRRVLKAFDALSPAEQRQVAAEILRRTPASSGVSGAALQELADELFRGYDAEEAARADPGQCGLG